MRRLRGTGPVGIPALVSIGIPTATLADDECSWPSDGIGVVYRGTSVATGARADVDLYAAAPESGFAILHPFQVLSNVGDGDFIGRGTYRGVGTDFSTITNCPTYNDAGWRVYADGMMFGQYWCRATYGVLSSAAANQQFKAVSGTCSDGTTRWVLYLNGQEKTCARMSSSSAIVAVGGESAYILPLPTQTINVDYENLQVRFNSGWAYWGSNAQPCPPTNPLYYYDKVSNTEYLMRRHP
jgi:hypothetical protein